MQKTGKAGRNGHHGRHGAQCQRAHGLVHGAFEVLAQQLLLMNDTLGGDKDALPLGRETFKRTPAFDNGGAKFKLQRTNRIGQGGLGNVAGTGRAPEMLVLMQRDQIPERGEQAHGA